MEPATPPAQAISGERMKHHDIIIQSPRDIATSNAPLVLQRSDEDFLDAVLEQFRTPTGRHALREDIITHATGSQVLKLFQPIQRRFYVAIVEVLCNQPGHPRLDPTQADGAGMVVRRLGKLGNNGIPVYQGWMRGKAKLRGWMPLDTVGGDEADPLPAHRMAARATGVAQIDRALAPLYAGREDAILSEQTVPLFVAPPDICSDAKQTLYYGLVQTASSELAESEPESPYANFGPKSNEFRLHLVEHLRGEWVNFPLPGEDISPEWFDVFELGNVSVIKNLSPNVAALANKMINEPQNSDILALRRFILLLRQLSVEFDAFGESPESKAIFAQLEGIELPYKPSEEQMAQSTTAGQFLKQASQVLLERDATAIRPEMPSYWPNLTVAATDSLAHALSDAMISRFRALNSKDGRFDEPDARYVLRAFVRLKPEGACPAKIHWTDYTEPFVIAPWYEGAGAPPAKIPLPDLSNKDLLKSLKPNIAFVVPEALQGLLGNNPKDMLKGEGKNQSAGLGIGWLCSFSIPIITICAFIVLNIFLSLFDLFFQWMLFFKICIPYPKKN